MKYLESLTLVGRWSNGCRVVGVQNLNFRRGVPETNREKGSSGREEKLGGGRGVKPRGGGGPEPPLPPPKWNDRPITPMIICCVTTIMTLLFSCTEFKYFSLDQNDTFFMVTARIVKNAVDATACSACRIATSIIVLSVSDNQGRRQRPWWRLPSIWKIYCSGAIKTSDFG